MEILLDTANLELIQKYNEIYEIAGVSSNPTILSKEKADFFPLLIKIRDTIGNKQLHVQVTGNTCEQMLKEAQRIVSVLGRDTYIKVPANEEGIKTMKTLKEKAFRVTATAVYMPQQAMVSASVGADYVAPYYNRICNLSIDGKMVIREISELFNKHEQKTKILAASFKNTQQIMEALNAGAQAVTASPELYTQMVSSPMIDAAIAGFASDWKNVYGDMQIDQL
ncbi:MAG: fructose-6-phosphate aldolase [Lachnospiraceae bacterium]